jgi:hypothetical protein
VHPRRGGTNKTKVEQRGLGGGVRSLMGAEPGGEDENVLDTDGGHGCTRANAIRY